MHRLTALVPPAVCAAALGRVWPDDLDGQVRCLDEGARSLGLRHSCAPWSTKTEDAALLEELGMGGLPRGGSTKTGDAALPKELDMGPLASAGAAQEAADDDTFERLDEVAAGLAATPGAPPVLGVVSGPLGWGSRLAAATPAAAGAAADPVEAIDAAADLAADRLRTLARCGVEEVAVVETGAVELYVDPAVAAESHDPLVKVAAHLRLGLVLVCTGTTSAEDLGYGRWVSSRGCSPGLGFLPDEALGSHRRLRRVLAGATDGPDDREMITAPLDDRVAPGLVRMAAAMLDGPASGVSR